MRKILAVVASLGIATLGIAAPAHAATTMVDFESVTGPANYTVADAPLTLDGATFTGGQVLTAVAGLSANTTSVYGTASCDGCKSAITIEFAAPVSNFSADVYNGDRVSVSYTVQSNSGSSDTKTLEGYSSTASAGTFSLPASGVTQVTIAPTTPGFRWNFFIDNVSFESGEPTTKDDCKGGAWAGYGTFKNQGDCVSFVATKGKNDPVK